MSRLRDVLAEDTINEAVTFKSMEKKCIALQNLLDKFDQGLSDFQEIEDDRPLSKRYTKPLYKSLDKFSKDLETLKTYLRKTN
jgi:hypothetical protein